jgi:pimeloyl-ACP methyl ester carboxylesterase
VGGSTGSTSASTSQDLAGDVLAGVAFLKGRKEIDPARIGLIGHSEGGLIAPMVAARSKDIAFAVLLAGPGLPGIDLLLLQGGLIARAAGASEADVAQGQAVNKRLYAALASTTDDKDAESKIRAILHDPSSTPDASTRKPADDDAIVQQLVNPWFRYFVKYDPRPALKKMKCPALALGGEKDMQVPPRENLAEIKKANPRIVTKQLPGLNHLFQTAKTGAPQEYATIEETFAPSALDEISAFVLDKTRKK